MKPGLLFLNVIRIKQETTGDPRAPRNVQGEGKGQGLHSLPQFGTWNSLESSQIPFLGRPAMLLWSSPPKYPTHPHARSCCAIYPYHLPSGTHPDSLLQQVLSPPPPLHQRPSVPGVLLLCRSKRGTVAASTTWHRAGIWQTDTELEGKGRVLLGEWGPVFPLLLGGCPS